MTYELGTYCITKDIATRVAHLGRNVLLKIGAAARDSPLVITVVMPAGVIQEDDCL